MRPDRLGRIGEGRVVAVDQRLGDDGDGLAREAALAELVPEGFHEHVADRPLQVGAGIVHRHRRDLVDRELRATKDEAHLRAVAVGDDDDPARLDHVGDMRDGQRHPLELIGDRHVILVADEGIAADRDDGELGHLPLLNPAALLPPALIPPWQSIRAGRA
jgi:hypothetical protein